MSRRAKDCSGKVLCKPSNDSSRMDGEKKETVMHQRKMKKRERGRKEID